jgi:hypothetical protein
MKLCIVTLLASALLGCGGAEFTLVAEEDASPTIESSAADDAGEDARTADSGPPFEAHAQDSGAPETSPPDSGSASEDAEVDAPCTPIAHSDGLGQTYLDCAPLGTYTQTTALEACTAWTGNVHHCSVGIIGCDTMDYVCGDTTVGTTGYWSCWDFDPHDSGNGRVHKWTTGVMGCVSASDLRWN